MKLRLTIVTPYLPYPEVGHGGGQDLFHLIRVLGGRHEIRLVSFVDDDQALHKDAIRPYVNDLHLIRPAIDWQARLKRLLIAVRHGRLADLGRRADREMREAIRAAPADVLHCAWTEMGRYLGESPPGVVRVLDEVDVRYLVDEAAGRPRRQRQHRQRQELAYCRAADLVLTRSRRDLTALQEALPGLEGLVLPPIGHMAAFRSIDPQSSLPDRVLFMGAMDRARNQAAALWLAEHIWPRVRQTCPEAELRIVGARPPARIQALGRIPGVTVTGWVDDLGQEYARSRVVVAPMRSEAGALNKVLDGLAAGRPVVATPVANAGIEAPAGAIWLASEAQPFAEAVIRLLNEEETWKRQAEAGRAYVLAAFDWPATVARYEETLLALTAARREEQVAGS